MLVEEEKILKFECTLEHIIFPKYAKEIKSGEFGIFKALITKKIENTEYNNDNILFKKILSKLT